MKKRSRENLNIEITPLIDVVFLLLIFFMVSTVFKKDEMALLLNLPKVEKGESAQNNSKTLYIELNDLEVAIGGKKVSLENADSELSKIKDKQKVIELRIDKTVRYERVVILLDKLKRNQLHNLSLITEQ